jgi:hypothetical protein
VDLGAQGVDAFGVHRLVLNEIAALKGPEPAGVGGVPDSLMGSLGGTRRGNRSEDFPES